jgi:hypothetical protein
MNLASAAGPFTSSIARASAPSWSLSCSLIGTEVKHCFAKIVKHYLIHGPDNHGENHLVLDALELARRLRQAMDTASPRITSAAVAKACAVTPQAVHGWRKTGRIAKRYLTPIAALTKRPLEYFLDDVPGTQSRFALELDEALAVKKLRDAHPSWRRYVLGLALLEKAQQELMLRTLRLVIPASDEPENPTAARLKVSNSTK